MISADFGLKGLSDLSGLVFRDDSLDGLFNGPDRGISQVQVTATWDGADAVSWITNTTGSGLSDAVVTDGMYLVTGLPAGDVRIAVTAATIPAGLLPTTSGYTTSETVPAAGSVVAESLGYGRNLPPVAIDDSATTLSNTSVDIPILANDDDPDGAIDPSRRPVPDQPGRTQAQASVGRPALTSVLATMTSPCGKSIVASP